MVAATAGTVSTLGSMSRRPTSPRSHVLPLDMIVASRAADCQCQAEKVVSFWTTKSKMGEEAHESLPTISNHCCPPGLCPDVFRYRSAGITQASVQRGPGHLAFEPQFSNQPNKVAAACFCFI